MNEKTKNNRKGIARAIKISLAGVTLLIASGAASIGMRTSAGVSPKRALYNNMSYSEEREIALKEYPYSFSVAEGGCATGLGVGLVGAMTGLHYSTKKTRENKK